MVITKIYNKIQNISKSICDSYDQDDKFALTIAKIDDDERNFVRVKIDENGIMTCCFFVLFCQKEWI